MLQIHLLLLLLQFGEHIVGPPLPLREEAVVGLHLSLRLDGLEDGLQFRRPLLLGQLHHGVGHGEECSRWRRLHLARVVVLLLQVCFARNVLLLFQLRVTGVVIRLLRARVLCDRVLLRLLLRLVQW